MFCTWHTSLLANQRLLRKVIAIRENSENLVLCRYSQLPWISDFRLTLSICDVTLLTMIRCNLWSVHGIYQFANITQAVADFVSYSLASNRCVSVYTPLGCQIQYFQRIICAWQCALKQVTYTDRVLRSWFCHGFDCGLCERAVTFSSKLQCRWNDLIANCDLSIVIMSMVWRHCCLSIVISTIYSYYYY